MLKSEMARRKLRIWRQRVAQGKSRKLLWTNSSKVKLNIRVHQRDHKINVYFGGGGGNL